ncbi:MAG: VOC family protein [Thermoanaerobaculia bacterium]
MRFAGTVLYVDSVPPVLDFYARAFGLEPNHIDLDVQMPGRRPEERYAFATFRIPGGELHLATHALGALFMPEYERPPAGGPLGVEIAFYVEDVPAAFQRAVDAGATAISEPRETPWGQTVSYVRSIEGTFVGICSPPAPSEQ